MKDLRVPRFGAVWGRYETRDYARMARNRFKDEPGAYHRVRYMPSEAHPDMPWCVVVFDWQCEADEIDANGEVRV